MVLKKQKDIFKQIWANSSNKLKRTVYILIAFSIYAVLILVLFPTRYYRSGKYFPGLSGWEFGLLLLILYYFITTILLEPPLIKEKKEENKLDIKFSYKNPKL